MRREMADDDVDIDMDRVQPEHEHREPAVIKFLYMWEKMGFALMNWATKCRRITSKIVRSKFRWCRRSEPHRYQMIELDIHWLDQFRDPPGSEQVDLYLIPQYHLRMELFEPEDV